MVNRDTLAQVLKHDQIAIAPWIQQLAAREAANYPRWLPQALDALYYNIIFEHRIEPHYLMYAVVAVHFYYRLWTGKRWPA